MFLQENMIIQVKRTISNKYKLQMQAEKSKENTNLSEVLGRGDLSILKSMRKAIILVGKTRAGKSTVFNWILRKALVGVGHKKFAKYELAADDNTSAGMKASFVSCTLAPNVHVHYTEDVTLIDMAGFEDKRDYIGTIGVSYFLKAVFEVVKEIKFVMVFDEHSLEEEDGKGITSTFNGFINLFNFKDMDDDTKHNLKQSMGIVVTRSKSQEDHYEYLQMTAKNLKHPDLVTQNKELIVEFIEHLTNQARIEPFRLAISGNNPQECTFIEHWSTNMKWEYFNLAKAESKSSNPVISLPLLKQYEKLSQKDQDEFIRVIEKKAASYGNFANILKIMLQTFLQNWANFLGCWKDTKKINWDLFKMNDLFAKISEFLVENDDYNSSSIIDIPLRVSYEPMKLGDSVNVISKVCRIVQEIGTSMQGEFTEVMKIYDIQFKLLAQLLNKFSSSQEDEQKVERLKYVLSRGFRQFSMLFEMKPDSVGFFKLNLIDCLNNNFQEQEWTFLEKILIGMTPQLLSEAFPDINLLKGYENILKHYEIQYSYKQPLIFFSKQRCSIEMAKADIVNKAGQKLEALQYYCHASKSYGKIYQCVNDSNEENKEVELTKLSMQKAKVIKRIVHILITILDQKSFNPKSLALQLCKHHRFIDETCSTYQLLIDSTIVSAEKINFYSDYISYCKEWGSIDKAFQLTLKKLSLEEDCFESQKLAAFECKQLLQKGQELKLAAITKFTSWQTIPGVDETLNMILDEIEAQVQKYKASLDADTSSATEEEVKKMESEPVGTQ